MKPCKKCGGTDRNKYGQCKPCKQVAQAKWYINNPEKAKLAGKKYKSKIYAVNPEKFKNAEAKRYADNPEKKKANALKWARDNPESCCIKSQNRRARKCANGGKLSKGLSEKLFRLQRGICACGCGKKLGYNYHLDHRMPLSLGGANEDWNMQLLRQQCNNQKHAKHPIDFMQSRGFLL